MSRNIMKDWNWLENTIFWYMLMMLRENINIMKINTETLLEPGREIGLHINVEKIKCTVRSLHQNAGQSHDSLIAKFFFENVAKFTDLVSTVTNENYIHDGIKSKLNSGNAWYHSLQNLLSSRLPSKNSSLKYTKTQYHLFFVWICNLVSHTTGRT
jgi:hypothetical protein